MSKPTPTHRERPEVEVVSSRYQPSKAEMEEEIDLTPLEGQTLEDLARMVLAPVETTIIPRPRS